MNISLNDRLRVHIVPKCGWPKCKHDSETGYGWCKHHLNLGTKA